MKMKSDFITNSSSSSFVIMTKEKMDKKQLEDEIISILGEQSLSNIFPMIVNRIATVLTSDLKEVDIVKYINYYTGYDSVDDLKESGYFQNKKIAEYYTEYPYLYVGSTADDSDEPVEVMLVDEDINFKNNKMIIIKEGGY